MEDREKTWERDRNSLHMFPSWENFSLPDLTFSISRNSTSGLAKETMKHSSTRPQSKCEMFCFNRLQEKKGTLHSPSESYLLKSSSQSCGRGKADEEKKGRGGVSLWFGAFLPSG